MENQKLPEPLASRIEAIGGGQPISTAEMQNSTAAPTMADLLEAVEDEAEDRDLADMMDEMPEQEIAAACQELHRRREYDEVERIETVLWTRLEPKARKVAAISRPATDLTSATEEAPEPTEVESSHATETSASAPIRDFQFIKTQERGTNMATSPKALKPEPNTANQQIPARRNQRQAGSGAPQRAKKECASKPKSKEKTTSSVSWDFARKDLSTERKQGLSRQAQELLEAVNRRLEEKSLVRLLKWCDAEAIDAVRMHFSDTNQFKKYDRIDDTLANSKILKNRFHEVDFVYIHRFTTAQLRDLYKDHVKCDKSELKSATREDLLKKLSTLPDFLHLPSPHDPVKVGQGQPAEASSPARNPANGPAAPRNPLAPEAPKGPGETTTMLLKIAQIRTDGTQTREKLDEETVEEYRERKRAGDAFPPVVVFYDGKDYWLADGFHRLEADRRAELRQIEAIVHQGARRDAILHGITNNRTHGLKRTDDDKRKCVRTLLEDPEWRGWSDNKIAQVCGVSTTLVGTIRKTVSFHNGKIGERRVERGGKTFTMRTEGIGGKGKPKPRAKKAAQETANAEGPAQLEDQADPEPREFPPQATKDSEVGKPLEIQEYGENEDRADDHGPATVSEPDPVEDLANTIRTCIDDYRERHPETTQDWIRQALAKVSSTFEDSADRTNNNQDPNS